MDRSTKQAWLEGPGDLKEADVEDVPVKGQSVRVRGLPAAFSNEAQSEALEMVTRGREQIATVNTAKMEIIQFAHGVVEPSFSLAEAKQVAEKFGPAFRKVIDKIDELSAVDKEAIESAQARFQGGGEAEDGASGSDGAPAGDGRSDIRTRTGA
jgi:hypothetical protein